MDDSPRIHVIMANFAGYENIIPEATRNYIGSVLDPLVGALYQELLEVFDETHEDHHAPAHAITKNHTVARLTEFLEVHPSVRFQKNQRLALENRVLRRTFSRLSGGILSCVLSAEELGAADHGQGPPGDDMSSSDSESDSGIFAGGPAERGAGDRAWQRRRGRIAETPGSLAEWTSSLEQRQLLTDAQQQRLLDVVRNCVLFRDVFKSARRCRLEHVAEEHAVGGGGGATTLLSTSSIPPATGDGAGAALEMGGPPTKMEEVLLDYLAQSGVEEVVLSAGDIVVPTEGDFFVLETGYGRLRRSMLKAWEGNSWTGCTLWIGRRGWIVIASCEDRDVPRCQPVAPIGC